MIFLFQNSKESHLDAEIGKLDPYVPSTNFTKVGELQMFDIKNVCSCTVFPASRCASLYKLGILKVGIILSLCTRYVYLFLLITAVNVESQECPSIYCT